MIRPEMPSSLLQDSINSCIGPSAFSQLTIIENACFPVLFPIMIKRESMTTTQIHIDTWCLPPCLPFCKPWSRNEETHDNRIISKVTKTSFPKAIHDLYPGSQQPRYSSYEFFHVKAKHRKPHTYFGRNAFNPWWCHLYISVLFRPHRHRENHNDLGIINWRLNNTSSRLHALLPVRSVSKCRL